MRGRRMQQLLFCNPCLLCHCVCAAHQILVPMVQAQLPTKLNEGIWPLNSVHLGSVKPPKFSCQLFQVLKSKFLGVSASTGAQQRHQANRFGPSSHISFTIHAIRLSNLRIKTTSQKLESNRILALCLAC
eukprot:1150349-Pelagomonas_calceolata.AAC.4